MKAVALFETKARRAPLLPLAYTRSVADFRIGILTIREKWRAYTGQQPYILTEDYLQVLYPSTSALPTYFVDARICPYAITLSRSFCTSS